MRYISQFFKKEKKKTSTSYIIQFTTLFNIKYCFLFFVFYTMVTKKENWECSHALAQVLPGIKQPEGTGHIFISLVSSRGSVCLQSVQSRLSGLEYQNIWSDVLSGQPQWISPQLNLKLFFTYLTLLISKIYNTHHKKRSKFINHNQNNPTSSGSQRKKKWRECRRWISPQCISLSRSFKETQAPALILLRFWESRRYMQSVSLYGFGIAWGKSHRCLWNVCDILIKSVVGF